MKKKKFWLPALFSALLMGLGQITKGHSNRGLKWILSFYLLFPALIYVSFLIHANLFIVCLGIAVIVYPIFWLYNVLDALLAPIDERGGHEKIRAYRDRPWHPDRG